MKRLLVVGSGDVALRAIPWLARRFKVFALTRRTDNRAQLRAAGAMPLYGDLDCRATLRRCAGLADVVLHLAPPPRDGASDSRTAHLAAALASRRSLPQRLVYISTTGVYGDCEGALVDETRGVAPATARALRRVDAERRLRRFGLRNRMAVSILRAPGIYAADRLPTARLERGDPVLSAAHDVFTNHIHADDLAQAACLALFRGRRGRVYNVVDDSALKMGEYFDLAADIFGLPQPARVAPEVLRERVSPMALSFMSESRRIRNLRLKRELRMRLRYPSVREGLLAARAASGK